MQKSRLVAGLLIAITVACLGLLVFVTQTRMLQRAVDDLLYDNKNHYLPCDELPAAAEVNAIFQAHHDRIAAIELVNPGLVGVEIDSTTCPGKADLLIWYASHADRLEIEKIIGGDTFFGVPYRLQNR
jgi:hypothetical protein